MRCDLHGFELIGAKDEILLKLEECQLNGDKVLEIVHGYHGGQILRNYCLSQRLIDDTIIAGFKIKIKDFSDNKVIFILLLDFILILMLKLKFKIF